MNLSVKKIENRSTFGEVMDNIVVPCFFDSQCRYIFSRLDLYNNVILIFPPNFYSQRPTAVEILIINFKGSVFIGTPCSLQSYRRTDALAKAHIGEVGRSVKQCAAFK